MGDTPLLPERHPDSDLFICDIADAAIKDDMASMEHPVFVMTKKPYMQIRRYDHGYNWFEVQPSAKGVANIWDKDILIYAISQIMAAKNEGRPYSKEVAFTAFDFLVFSNRNTSGREYASLKDSLSRLRGTTLVTNIRTGDEEITEGFGLIESFKIKKEHLDGRVLEWGITLSDWLFNAIESNEVLSLNPEYFRLRKPLERRVYEIARKHCGTQDQWRISVDLLKNKCGSNSPKNKFKYMLKNIEEHQHLPDYNVNIINDTVLFTKVGNVGCSETERDDDSVIPPLKPRTYDIFRTKFPNIDPHHIEQEWRYWAYGKELPKNPDGAFLAFAKKYVEKHQHV